MPWRRGLERGRAGGERDPVLVVTLFERGWRAPRGGLRRAASRTPGRTSPWSSTGASASSLPGPVPAGSSPALYGLEVYLGSEGFLAIQDQAGAPTWRPHGSGESSEFVPVEALAPSARRGTGRERARRGWGTRCRDHGQRPWGSLIGDTVRFSSLRPPRLRFAGRTEQFLSASASTCAQWRGGGVVVLRADGGAIAEVHWRPSTERRLPETRHQWFVELDLRPPTRRLRPRVDTRSSAATWDYGSTAVTTRTPAARALPVPRGPSTPPCGGSGGSAGKYKVPTCERRHSRSCFWRWSAPCPMGAPADRRGTGSFPRDADGRTAGDAPQLKLLMRGHLSEVVATTALKKRRASPAWPTLLSLAG
jgi:hypothetical protein